MRTTLVIPRTVRMLVLSTRYENASLVVKSITIPQRSTQSKAKMWHTPFASLHIQFSSAWDALTLTTNTCRLPHTSSSTPLLHPLPHFQKQPFGCFCPSGFVFDSPTRHLLLEAARVWVLGHPGAVDPPGFWTHTCFWATKQHKAKTPTFIHSPTFLPPLPDRKNFLSHIT